MFSCDVLAVCRLDAAILDLVAAGVDLVAAGVFLLCSWFLDRGMLETVVSFLFT